MLQAATSKLSNCEILRTQGSRRCCRACKLCLEQARRSLCCLTPKLFNRMKKYFDVPYRKKEMGSE